MLRTDVILPSGEFMPGGAFNDASDLEPISGYACLIEYDGGAAREISCRRYEVNSEGLGYIGAICHAGYRQFRTDRVDAVFDLRTGEHLGDGEFFRRFAVTEAAAVDRWGLTKSRQQHLLAGLNILAFIARCDGEWHPLEGEAIADFVTAIWIQKEWDGQPPIERIVAHAQRLAPDGSIFGAALRNFIRSSNSERILRQAMVRVIEADGRITPEEFEWAVEIDAMISENRE